MAATTAVISYLVGPVLVGILAGRWIDQSLGTMPLFLIIGLFLGLGAGVFGFIRFIRHFLGEN